MGDTHLISTGVVSTLLEPLRTLEAQWRSRERGVKSSPVQGMRHSRDNSRRSSHQRVRIEPYLVTLMIAGRTFGSAAESWGPR